MAQIECLGAWPDTITEEEARNGTRIGIDYKLTSDQSTEEVVDVRGSIGSHTNTVTGETVWVDTPNYGTVFLEPAGIEDGAAVSIWIVGQDPPPDTSGDDSTSSSTSGQDAPDGGDDSTSGDDGETTDSETDEIADRITRATTVTRAFSRFTRST